MIYVITREENQYDQYGEYFVAAFLKRPSIEQRLALGIEHYKRLKNENTWYNLRKLKEGEEL